MVPTPIHPHLSGYFSTLHHEIDLVTLWLNGPLPPSQNILFLWFLCTSLLLCFFSISLASWSSLLSYLTRFHQGLVLYSLLFSMLLGCTIRPPASTTFTMLRTLKGSHQLCFHNHVECFPLLAAYPVLVAHLLGNISMGMCLSLSAS